MGITITGGGGGDVSGEKPKANAGEAVLECGVGLEGVAGEGLEGVGGAGIDGGAVCVVGNLEDLFFGAEGLSGGGVFGGVHKGDGEVAGGDGVALSPWPETAVGVLRPGAIG